MKDKTEWNLLEEQFQDLLNMEKAHLPSLPAPPERCEPQPPKLMREEVVRDLESQVRQLIEEHVFEREIKLKEVKETMAKKIEEVARALGLCDIEARITILQVTGPLPWDSRIKVLGPQRAVRNLKRRATLGLRALLGAVKRGTTSVTRLLLSIGGREAGDFDNIKALLSMVQRAKFRQPVYPGDTLTYSVEVGSWNEKGGTANVKATVKDERVAECDLMFSFHAINDPFDLGLFVFG